MCQKFNGRDLLKCAKKTGIREKNGGAGSVDFLPWERNTSKISTFALFYKQSLPPAKITDFRHLPRQREV